MSKSFSGHSVAPCPNTSTLFVLMAPTTWFGGWLKSLPRAVAYQVDEIHRSLLADTAEMATIEPDIESLIEARCSPERIASILREFSTRLGSWEWDSNDDGEDSSEDEVEGLGRGQPLQRRPSTKPQTILEILRRVIADDQKRGAKPVTMRAPGVFDCLHVNVTPTAIQIDGGWHSVAYL